MASEMVRPTVTTFLDEMLRDTNLNLRIEELTVPENFQNKTIEELPINGMYRTLLLAIKEQDTWKYNPPKNYVLTKNSVLIVMTTPEEHQEMQQILDA